MKKLILFTCAVIMLLYYSFTQKTNAYSLGTKINAAKTPLNKSKFVFKSLNGIKEKGALKMIKLFENQVFKKQKLSQLNFWFGKQVINDIVQLIKDDSVAMKSSPHNVDGIRIYFASDTINPLKVSIILVTTINNFKGILHYDYYRHFSDEHLFSDTGIAGNVFKRGKCSGANLYYHNIRGIFDDASCDFKNHPHYIKRSTGRKMVNNFGTDNINTKAEWLPTQLFEDIASDNNCDGMRIYFAKHLSKKNADTIFNNRDAFVIATTGKDPKNEYNHIDYFNCKSFKRSAKYTRIHQPNLFYSPGQDNGSLCPNDCN